MALLDEGLHYRIAFDQCRQGAPSRKRITIQGSIALDLLEYFGDTLCNHGRVAHTWFHGLDSGGNFLTSQAMDYPSARCRKVAARVVEALPSGDPDFSTSPQECAADESPFRPISDLWREP